MKQIVAALALAVGLEAGLNLLSYPAPKTQPFTALGSPSSVAIAVPAAHGSIGWETVQLQALPSKSEEPVAQKPESPASPIAPAHSDLLIVPGKRVGLVTAATTFDKLVSLYGADKLKNQLFSVGEGEQQPATRVDLGDARSFTVIWQDAGHSKAIAVSQLGPAWRTPEGIGVGTTLTELQGKLGPFKLYGFGWDYGGAVILEGTKLAKYRETLFLQLSPDLVAAQAHSKDLQAVSGDEAIDSSNSHLTALEPSVKKIIVRLLSD